MSDRYLYSVVTAKIISFYGTCNDLGLERQKTTNIYRQVLPVSFVFSQMVCQILCFIFLIFSR